MELIHFCVGSRVPGFATGDDSCVIEYGPAGLTMLYLLDEIQPYEMEEFETNRAFQIALTDMLGVGFFSMKVGELPWIDAPFSPCIYEPKPEFSPLEPGMGYALNLILVDSSVGEVKAIRLIGLGAEFSTKFREWCLEKENASMNRDSYKRIVRIVYDRFTTYDLEKRAFLRWELPENEQ